MSLKVMKVLGFWETGIKNFLEFFSFFFGNKKVKIRNKINKSVFSKSTESFNHNTE